MLIAAAFGVSRHAQRQKDASDDRYCKGIADRIASAVLPGSCVYVGIV